MLQRKNILVLLLAVGLTFGFVGCKSKPVETVPTPAPVQEPTPEPTPPPVEVREDIPEPIKIEEAVEPTIQELNMAGHLKTVYFDFDKYELSETTRATIRHNADWLRVNPGHNLVIEGHCDDRGSIEYNLALGERRANATREFLASLGAGNTEVRIVTFGEERPAVQGSSESAWSKNRRAEFTFE
jgi:peptidoglycan-associated lipoprotein